MKKLLCVLLLVSAAGFSACSGGGGTGGSSSDPNRGFDLQLFASYPNITIQTGALANGQLLAVTSQTTGTVDSFSNREINGIGFTRINGAKAPGTWRFVYPTVPLVPTLCLAPTITDRYVSRGELVRLYCTGRLIDTFDASPNTIDLQNPPSTVTISGKGIENIYGAPAVALYDSQGNFVSSTVPDSYSTDTGEIDGIIITVPDLSQATNGSYTLTVSNVASDGTLEVVGAASITVIGDIIEPPPDPCRQQFPCE